MDPKQRDFVKEARVEALKAQKVSIGRIVLWRSASSNGEQAAVVTKVDAEEGTINVMALPDRGTSVPKYDVEYNPDTALQSASDTKQYWRWPPRV